MGVQMGLSSSLDCLQICSLYIVPKSENLILWEPMGRTGHQLL